MSKGAKGASGSDDSHQQTTQNIIVNRQLQIKPFTISSDVNETAMRWSKWKKDIDRQFRFFGFTDPTIKKDGLIIYGGQDIADIDDSMPDLTAEGDEDAYSLLIRKLDKYFLPRKNKDYARFQFGNLSQQEDENMAQYYSRIRDIAKKCEFTNEDEALRDHLIKTMMNNKLWIKTIRNNWSLAQILDEAAIEEEATSQANEMQKKLETEIKFPKVKQVTKGETRTEYKQCGRCGLKHDRKNCKAYGVECYKCGKRNHYARMCNKEKSKDHAENKNNRSIREDTKHSPRNTTRNNRSTGKQQYRSYRKHIRYVEQQSDEESPESDSDSADEDIGRIVQHLNIHRTSRVESEKHQCKIWINGTEVTVEPDTGADANVMDE